MNLGQRETFEIKIKIKLAAVVHVLRTTQNLVTHVAL